MLKIAISKDLTGKVFGKLTVLRGSNKRDKFGYILWECQCSCENKTIKFVSTNYLITGKTRSCGCLVAEMKKKNKYVLDGEYGIGWTSNTNKEFYFDLEDYEKIKDYTWHEKHGYLVTKINRNQSIFLHRLVMNINDTNMCVDHVLHNLMDNRKSQLRVVTHQQNCCNTKVSKSNKSGVTGVSCMKNGRWKAELTFKTKVYKKTFNTFDEAVAQRKSWEKEFFGEYAYQEPPPEYIKELQRLN